tara:strand:+ start:430 stop:666 length:237 start_codon:yes stop_codon:yes gene_type:complete
MFSTTTRIKIQNILKRIENNQSVTLEERIYLNKLSSVSTVVSSWVNSSLGSEANSIDNDMPLKSNFKYSFKALQRHYL